MVWESPLPSRGGHADSRLLVWWAESVTGGAAPRSTAKGHHEGYYPPDEGTGAADAYSKGPSRSSPTPVTARSSLEGTGSAQGEESYILGPSGPSPAPQKPESSLEGDRVSPWRWPRAEKRGYPLPSLGGTDSRRLVWRPGLATSGVGPPPQPGPPRRPLSSCAGDKGGGCVLQGLLPDSPSAGETSVLP